MARNFIVGFEASGTAPVISFELIFAHNPSQFCQHFRVSFIRLKHVPEINVKFTFDQLRSKIIP